MNRERKEHWKRKREPVGITKDFDFQMAVIYVVLNCHIYKHKMQDFVHRVSSEFV